MLKNLAIAVTSAALGAIVAGPFVAGFVESYRPRADIPAVAGAASVTSDDSGHLRTSGSVSGHPGVDFMVDTGASLVTLRRSTATTLGLKLTDRDYRRMVVTANGTVRGASVVLDRVKIGNVAIDHVQAIVLPDEALTENLLGMSFLSRTHSLEFSDGTLVMR